MKNKWEKVNKCLICGTKLTFVPSQSKDALPGEGTKACDTNHERFMVVGRFVDNQDWDLVFYIPG